MEAGRQMTGLIIPGEEGERRRREKEERGERGEREEREERREVVVAQGMTMKGVVIEAPDLQVGIVLEFEIGGQFSSPILVLFESDDVLLQLPGEMRKLIREARWMKEKIEREGGGKDGNERREGWKRVIV